MEIDEYDWGGSKACEDFRNAKEASSLLPQSTRSILTTPRNIWKPSE